ncbi:MAG: hypothetical protein QJR03_03050 [Sphaerobacter sp.]|nr:hypothetical protein [Sphaerobacter sp.]
MLEALLNYAAFAIIATFMVLVLAGVLRVLYSPIWSGKRGREDDDHRRHEG